MSLTIIKTKPVERSLSASKKVQKEKPIMWADAEYLADHFEVSKTTLWRWRNRKINPLPAHKNDGVTRFDLIECDAWFKGEL